MVSRRDTLIRVFPIFKKKTSPLTHLIILTYLFRLIKARLCLVRATIAVLRVRPAGKDDVKNKEI